MPAFTVSTDIDAPPERVFAAVSDLAGHGRWSGDPLEVTPESEGPVGVGSRFRSHVRVKGRDIDAEITVTSCAPDGELTFQVQDLTGSYVHRFTVTPSGDGSHVERQVRARLTLPQALLFWLVLLPVKLPNARKAMARLKAQMEKETA